MAIPDYEEFLDPLVRAISDGKEHRFRDVLTTLIDRAGITDEEREQLLPSGKNKVVNNRINWAKTYLKKAGLVDYPARGVLKPTAIGLEASKKATVVDNRFLAQFPTYVAFTDRPIKPEDSPV